MTDIFSENELYKLDYGERIAKMHKPTGRKLTYSFSPQAGSWLEISGDDVPGGSLLISFDGEHLNMFADILAHTDFSKYIS